MLLARYHLYDDAIQHFQAALEANPSSDEIKFALADAYFHKRLYPQALDAAQQVSDRGAKDDGYLALLGDIYGHLGDSARAEEIYAMPSVAIQTTIRTISRWRCYSFASAT